MQRVFLLALCCSAVVAFPLTSTEEDAKEQQELLKGLNEMDQKLAKVPDATLDLGIQMITILVDTKLTKDQKTTQINALLDGKLDSVRAEELAAGRAKLSQALDLIDYAEELFNSASEPVRNAQLGMLELLKKREFYRGMTVDQRLQAVNAIFGGLTKENNEEFNKIYQQILQKGIDMHLIEVSIRAVTGGYNSNEN